MNVLLYTPGEPLPEEVVADKSSENTIPIEWFYKTLGCNLVQLVRVKDGALWIDENGKLDDDAEANDAATLLAYGHLLEGDVIVGKAVFTPHGPKSYVTCSIHDGTAIAVFKARACDDWSMYYGEAVACAKLEAMERGCQWFDQCDELEPAPTPEQVERADFLFGDKGGFLLPTEGAPTLSMKLDIEKE